MFVAPPGWEFSYYDMSQIEARIVACLAHIPKWLSQFNAARLNPGTYDAHCALAAEMFKVPYEQVPTHDRDGEGRPTIRYIAKRCRHGLNYRMAPTDLPRSQAYHLSRLSKPIVSTTWQAQRSPCGGMTWLHSSAGTVLSLPASDDDGCCWSTGERTP
jgi:hypothetical protein